MNHRERMADIEESVKSMFYSHTDYEYLLARIRTLTEALELCTYDPCGFDPYAEYRETLIEILIEHNTIARNALEGKNDTTNS